MKAYLYPVNEAMIHFPLIALALTVPYVLYSYHKYGSISIWRSVILFSFFYYLLSAFYLVVLPLPDPATVTPQTTSDMQLKPFTFVRRFLSETNFNLSDPSTYIRAMRHPSFYQPVFNVLLTLPFGVYLSYYFRQNVLQTIILSFLLSLFFEVTQLTGLYGIYKYPYRLFDVDDLMLNTLGGAIGFLLGKGFAVVFPNRKQIDDANFRKSERVGYFRRLVASALDLGFCVAMLLGLELVGVSANAVVLYALYFVYFVGVQTIMRGRTLGKAFVRIRVVAVDTKWPLILHLLIKYGLLLALFLLVSLLLDYWHGSIWQFLLVTGIVLAFIGLDWLMSFRRDRRLWYEVLSRTRNENTLRIPQQNA